MVAESSTTRIFIAMEAPHTASCNAIYSRTEPIASWTLAIDRLGTSTVRLSHRYERFIVNICKSVSVTPGRKWAA